MSQGSSKNDSVQWLLPEFGLQNHSKHTTQKKLKAKSVTFAKNAQIQLEADFNNGFKKGYDAGLAQGTNEVNKKLTQLSALICELNAFKNSLDEQFSQKLHQFTVLICEKIIMEKVSVSDAVLLNIVNRAMDIIDNQASSLKIYCSQNLLNQLSNQTQSKRVVFEKDDSLNDFNFKIESDRQFLEFNLHDALLNLINETKDDLLGTNK